MLRTPIQIPLSLLVLLVLLAGAAVVQGWRVARDAQRLLEPGPAVSVPLTGETSSVEVTENDRFLAVKLPDQASGRWGLYQILPERTLVRWIGPAADRPSGHLVIPLQGLSEGQYAITRHSDDASATTRDMDRPPEALDIAGKFRLHRR